MRSLDFISAWENHPDYYIEVETVTHHVQVKIMGKVIVDSNKYLLLREQNLKPQYYFPREYVIEKYFTLGDTVSFCQFKGLASHWTFEYDLKKIKQAVLCYEVPFKKLQILKNHVTFCSYDDIEIIIDMDDACTQFVFDVKVNGHTR
jgi:uncharacterized protein (DUF427 family)